MIEFNDFNGKCWWCESSDLSREHKYKKSDIKREYFSDQEMQDRVTINLVSIKDLSEKGKAVQGPNSNAIKFEANLCKNCNNSRSQSFDLAYDKLIEFLKLNESTTLTNPQIDLLEIYGNDWELEKENLVKYFIKNLGCVLTEFNLKVPQILIDYLDGVIGLPENLNLFISQSVDRKNYLDLAQIQTPPASWVGRSDVQCKHNNETSTINFFHYELYYRSFSFYIKLDKESKNFSSNFNDSSIDLILYNEDPFEKLYNEMKQN